MSDIRIRPHHQGAILLAVLALIGAIIATQLPEIQRYLKIRSM